VRLVTPAVREGANGDVGGVLGPGLHICHSNGDRAVSPVTSRPTTFVHRAYE
jgi:hypothetical protein